MENECGGGGDDIRKTKTVLILKLVFVKYKPYLMT